MNEMIKYFKLKNKNKSNYKNDNIIFDKIIFFFVFKLKILVDLILFL